MQKSGKYPQPCDSPPHVQVVKNLLVNETYVLYQCGTNAPSTNSLPVGAKMFSMPLTSVAVLETVPIAFLVSQSPLLEFSPSSFSSLPVSLSALRPGLFQL